LPAHLLFEDPPYSGLPAQLLFGGAGSVLAAPASVTVGITCAAAAFSAAVVYDNRVTRWHDQRLGSRFEVAKPSLREQASSWGVSKPELGGTALPWRVAAHAAGGAAVLLAVASGRTTARGLRYEVARPAEIVTVSGLPAAGVVGTALDGAWQRAFASGALRAVAVQAALARQMALLAGWQRAVAKVQQRSHAHGAGRTLAALAHGMPWQQARHAPNGKSAWPPLIPMPPLGYVPSAHLLFQCPPLAAPWLLLFGDKPCYLDLLPSQFAILPARFYMTIHNVHAELLPSLADVPLYAGTTISQDVGSYGWTLSATGPDALYEQLKPLPGQPKQIRLTINGIQWVFAIDHPSKSHSFGKKVTQITGRSVTAALGPAFALEAARMNTAEATAQQLAALALDNTGITLDWGIDDWLVPAGAWSHYGTPLAAVQAIAKAAGGYVQSHRNLPQLQVRHPYPLLPGGVLGGPWNWAGAFAPDVMLAPDAIISRQEELRDAPAINAVYVSGTTQGVLALVKREGTAGDLLGAQITDALITEAVAARQRGLSVLGAAGGRIMRRLELPVLTGAGQPGVLSTDQLIEVSDAVPWRGRVRAVSVTANSPSVRQNVLVEVA
jgi:hypothetical protein